MENTDPLKDYLNSLDKIDKLDVDVVLPAHEDSFTNHHERSKQLKDHHKQRLTEIINGLGVESLTAYALTSKVHLNVSYKSWRARSFKNTWPSEKQCLTYTSSNRKGS